MAKFGTSGEKEEKIKLILLSNLQCCHLFCSPSSWGEEEDLYLKLLYSKQFWFPYYQRCKVIGRTLMEVVSW